MSETHLRKKSDIFSVEDKEKIRSSLIDDIVIPGVKDILSKALDGIVGTVTDMAKTGFDLLIFGEPRKRRSSGSSSRIEYGSFYSRESKDDLNGRNSEKREKPFMYDDIVYENRGKAEEVLMLMKKNVSAYGYVSVADYYEFSDIPIGDKYTYHNYGWKNVDNISVVRDKDGYALELTKVIPLN